MEVIKFNNKIYKLEAIKRALEEYKSLAKFSLKENDDYIEVEIDEIDQEVKNVLKDEFANYVLGLMS